MCFLQINYNRTPVGQFVRIARYKKAPLYTSSKYKAHNKEFFFLVWLKNKKRSITTRQFRKQYSHDDDPKKIARGSKF